MSDWSSVCPLPPAGRPGGRPGGRPAGRAGLTQDGPDPV